MSFENRSPESTVGGAATQAPGAFAPGPAAGAGPIGHEAAAAPLSQTSGARSQGPFSPAISGLLSACYGHMLDGITVSKGEGAKNRGMGAEAHTIGRHISLGDRVKEDPTDGQSMEIIGHEVAHALAKGGSGQHVLDKKGDPGEHIAYDAGRQFRHFVEGGARGPAPQLKPAVGGLAAVHRFEGGEHKDAVDNATQELKDHGVSVDPNVANLMSEKNLIQLGNGLKVSAGDITAMMGDFYGAYNESDGKFNPAKAFEAMNDPKNRKEMESILKKIQGERAQIQEIRDANKEGRPAKKFEETSPGELEDITKYRKKETKGGVTTGLSMLELADRNNSHFSKKDESGTDNNMGAYNSFHAMALQAAKDGDMNKARALEASGMHFLTDRFAGGHQFDKDAVAKAFKDGHVGGNLPGGDLMATGAIRIFHNEGNEKGVQVKNAKGEDWDALGDSHWINPTNPEDPKEKKLAEDPNAKNRLKASQAVYDSFAELQAVSDGKKDPKMDPKDYAARQDVPVFDETKQAELEKRARETNRLGLTTKLIGPAANVLVPTIQRTLISNFGKDGETIVNNWDKAWNWTKESFGEAGTGLGRGLDALKNTASEAGTGIKNGLSAAGGFAKNTLNEAAGGISSGLSKAGDFLGSTGSDVATGIKNSVGKASSWASATLGEAKQGITGTASSAWNWFTGTIGGAVHQAQEGGVGSLVDYAKDKASEAGTGIHNGISKASDFAAQKVGEATSGIREGAGQAYDFTAQKLNEAGTGIKNGANQAYDWASHKVGEASTGIKNGANQAYDWASQKVGQASTGIHNGLDWASHKYGEAKEGLREHGRETWDATKRVARTAAGMAEDWAEKKVEPYVTPVKRFVSDQVHNAGTALHNGAQTVENVASGAYQGAKGAVSSGWGWLKHKAGY